MDLKSKSMAWVGNIYQKFETIGHDMDEIMNQSQERVKYVENQVQTIGESVKRFYSDVVHDLLPPLVDPVKHEGQVLARKKNAVVGTYKKPVMGIENDHIDAVNKQLCFKTGKTGSVENQPDHAFSGLPLLNQLGTPTHVNPPEDADIDLNSGQIKDISEVENLDEQAEENVKIEMSSTSGVLGVPSSVEEGFSGGPLLNELVDCNHKDAFGSLTNVSPATSVHGTQVESSQNVGKHCDHDCVSDVSKIITSSETNCSVPNEEKMGETEVDSFRISLLNCHHKDACGSGTNISPATSVHDTQVESSENVERHCDNDCVSDFSITIASPGTNISVVSSDDKMAETEVYSSRSSLLDYNHKDACGCITNVSPAASFYGMQVESSQNVGKHCDHDCVSDVSSTIASSKMNFSVVFNEETEVDSSRSSLLNCHCKDACASGTNVDPATSVYCTKVESSQNVKRHCDRYCVSDVSITIVSPESDISIISSDEKMEETDADSSRSSLVDCNHKDACESGANVSPVTSVHGTQVESSQNVDRYWDNDCFSNVSSTIASPETYISVVSSDEKMAETEIDCSTSFYPDCNHKDACESGTIISPVTSVHGTQVASSQNVNGHCDNDCFSYVPSTIISLETNLSVVSSNQKMAETEGDSSGSSLLDCNHKDARESGTNVSPVTSVSTQVKSSQNVDRYCDNVCFSDVSSIIASPEENFSVVTCDENMAEIDVDSSRSSLLTEPYYVLTHSPEAFPENAEWYHNSVSMSGAILDGPSAFASFTSVASHESKVVEMVPSRHVLPLNSIGNNRVELSPAQLKSPTFSSCIGAPSYSGNDDVDYSKLETIELSDKIKLENGCDVVADSFLYAVSRRSQRLRSFKKKIQDAFASRKRLEKEYEQLAIWFGDAEMGPCQDDLQNFLPSTATKILENRNSHARICNSDTEWELL